MDTDSKILNDDLFKAFSVASSHVYIYVCDMSTNTSRWSMNAVEYFNMPGEFMVDAGNIWMLKIHPEDRERYQKDIESVFSGASRKHKCEYRAMNCYGDYVWLECRGTMIYDDADHPRFFAGMMTRLDARNKYDPLTNLKTFYEFNHLDFSSGHGSVLLVGIDGFRTVVNNWGYSFGDMILFEFCQRMQAFCGDKRMLYRLDGDEFLIVSPGESREGTAILFTQVRELAKNLGEGRDNGINLSLSGGAVMYPEDGQKRDMLLRNMEHSMEHAKQSSRGNLIFFSREIAQQHNHILQVRQDIARSIFRDFEGFELYFQPIVDAKYHRVVCCEALLRWSGATVGRTDISEVIKLLEANGEIITVGRWIVDAVFRYAKQWQERYGRLTVGFNTSYLQFKDDKFVDYIIEKAKQYGVDPTLISIELTESCDVDDFARLADGFKRLRRFGFRISLDDFGIAYSTLLLVRNLPADSVKIDHSFVRNLTRENKVDLAIIDSVVSLCKKLNIDVVAEGVETQQVMELMSSFPISLLQGYHFAKPMPAADFEKVIFHQY